MPCGRLTRPLLRSTTRPVKNVLPLALTLMVKSSLPSRPSSARALNPVLKEKEASLPAAALLKVASIEPPVLKSMFVPKKTNLLVASVAALIPSSVIEPPAKVPPNRLTQAPAL